MKTLPDELVSDLREWFGDLETYVDTAIEESDSRQFPGSVMFSTLQSILRKHWQDETQLSKELRKLKVNNTRVSNRKPKEK